MDWFGRICTAFSTWFILRLVDFFMFIALLKKQFKNSLKPIKWVFIVTFNFFWIWIIYLIIPDDTTIDSPKKLTICMKDYYNSLESFLYKRSKPERKIDLFLNWYINKKYLKSRLAWGDFRYKFRLKFFKNGFYALFQNVSKEDFFKKYYNSFLYGLNFFFDFIKFWAIPSLLFISFVYFSLITKNLPFNKVIFQWFVIFMLLYLLVSGFVFFVKKYQFSKYTSVVQRFWKRSFIIFWVLELFLLSIFLFLTLNASQEYVHTLDNSQIYKKHLLSLRLFLIKSVPAALMIVLTYYTMLNLKWSTFSKSNIFTIVITFIISYLTWSEFYHYYHISNFYGNLVWIYDNNDKLWNLELEVRRTRIYNHYYNLLIFIKGVHVFFIFGFWIFTMLRNDELDRYRYPLFAANLQNFILLYVLNYIYILPYIKYSYRKYYNYPYKWFYINNRSVFWRNFFNDFKLFLVGFYLFFENIFVNLQNNILYYFNGSPSFYFKSLSKSSNYYGFKKNYINVNIKSELSDILQSCSIFF